LRTELCDGKAIRVAIEDSGPGIDKDKLDGIFTAFVTTKRHGMGLGLAISRMIVEYHGGKLTASSGQKGGASFQFVLPIASVDKDDTRVEKTVTTWTRSFQR
jgi:signal transduction histidine kinase